MEDAIGPGFDEDFSDPTNPPCDPGFSREISSKQVVGSNFSVIDNLDPGSK